MQEGKLQIELLKIIRDNLKLKKEYNDILKIIRRDLIPDYTYHKLIWLIQKNGLRKGRKSMYTPEIIEYVKNNRSLHSNKELAELINKEFNVNFTSDNIVRVKTDFLNRGKPYHFNDEKPAGALRQRRGFTEIKTGRGKWLRYHIYLWEKTHGRVPAGHYVIFLDGDKGNFEPDNLCLLSRSELSQLTTSGLKLSPGNTERNKTVITIIKSRQAITNRLKEKTVGYKNYKAYMARYLREKRG